MQQSNRENDSPRIKCSLVLRGRNLDFEDCSAFIGTAPTKTWQQRNIRLKGTELDAKEWILGFPKTVFYSLNDALQKLREIIGPYEARIDEYVQKHQLQKGVVCLVDYKDGGERPLLDLEPETLQWLAQLKAPLHLDIWVRA